MAKKIIITVLVMLLAGLLGVLYALPSFIDKEAVKSQLITSFKTLAGLDLEIQGEIKIIRFPTPHVLINSMYVHNAQGAATPFILTVKLVEIWPAYNSILHKHMGIRKVTFDDVDIEIERLKSGKMNWKDANVQTSAAAGMSGLANIRNKDLIGTTITVTNGYLRYTDSAANTATEYKDLSITFTNGGDKRESTLQLGVKYRDKPLTVSGKVGNILRALSVGEVPANLNITSGKTMLNYEGNAGYRNDAFFINGNVKLVTDNIVPWISIVTGSTEDPAAIGTEYKPLPLEAKSSINTEKGNVILPDLMLSGAIIKGEAKVVLTPPYNIDITGNIDSFDLETLFNSKLFALKQIADPLKEAMLSKENVFVAATKSLLSSLNLSVDLKMADTLYNSEHIKDSHLNFDMTDGEMTISQANMLLPGDTHVVFTGLGKEGMDGFTLEGELDAAGADFTQAIRVLRTTGDALPPEDFKRFRLKANTIFSQKEMRMSELTARIENIALVGGFVATFPGGRTKLNAALRIGGLDLDHIMNQWGLEKWRMSLFEKSPDSAIHDSLFTTWLKHLGFDANVSLTLEQYVLAGMPREKAEMKVEALEGKMALNELRTAINGSQIAGSLALDVTGVLPHMDVRLTTDTFDMDTFFTRDGKLPPTAAAQAPVVVGNDAAVLASASPSAGSPSTPTPATPAPADASAPPVNPATVSNLVPHWTHDQFDFHWMEMVNASFNFKFGRYKQGLIRAASLTMSGNVDNRTLTFDVITGYVLGAQVAAKANITAGRIPNASIAANVTSLDPVQLLPFFPLLKGMTGKYNLSLRLDTSGIDMYSWISSLEGTVGLGGNDVNIHGFNLPGVIRSVSYVRTVADILNVVRRAFPGGDTMFTNIEGQWSVAGGVLKTSNTRMTNEQADGILTSQVDLVNWQMQSSISIALRALDTAHPPGMIITFSGSLISPETALDTRSLERYVTNKTSERMLQQYGTQ